VVPRSLRLLYLKDAEACDYAPDAEELTRLSATWWRCGAPSSGRPKQRGLPPKPGRLCDWCSHKSRCPAYGGHAAAVPEPVPAPEVAAESLVVVDE